MCNGCQAWTHDDNQKITPRPSGEVTKVRSNDLREDICGMYVRHKQLESYREVTTMSLKTPCECKVCGSVRGPPFASALPSPFDPLEVCGVETATCNPAVSDEADALDDLVQKCDDDAQWANKRLFNEGHVESVSVDCGYAHGPISRVDEYAPRANHPWDRYAGSVCRPTVKSGCYFTGEANMDGNRCNCTADAGTFASENTDRQPVPATCDTTRKEGPFSVSCGAECETKCSAKGPMLSSCYGVLFQAETSKCWLVTDANCVAGGTGVREGRPGEPFLRSRPKPQETCWSSDKAPPHCCSTTDENYKAGDAPDYRDARCWNSDVNRWKQVLWKVGKIIVKIAINLVTAGAASAILEASKAVTRLAKFAVKTAMKVAMIGTKVMLTASVAAIKGVNDPWDQALGKLKSESIGLLKSSILGEVSDYVYSGAASDGNLQMLGDLDKTAGSSPSMLGLNKANFLPNGAYTGPMRGNVLALTGAAALVGAGGGGLGRVTTPSISWHRVASIPVNEYAPIEYSRLFAGASCEEINTFGAARLASSLAECQDVCQPRPFMVFLHHAGPGIDNCACLSSCTVVSIGSSEVHWQNQTHLPTPLPPFSCVEASQDLAGRCGEGYGSCPSSTNPCCSQFGYCHEDGDACGAQSQRLYKFCEPAAGRSRAPVPAVSLTNVPIFWMLWKMIDAGSIPRTTEAAVSALGSTQCLSQVPAAQAQLQELCCGLPGIAAEETCDMTTCNN